MSLILHEDIPPEERLLDLFLLFPRPSGLAFGLGLDFFLAGGPSVDLLEVELVDMLFPLFEPEKLQESALAPPSGGGPPDGFFALEVMTDEAVVDDVRTDVLGDVVTEATGTFDVGTLALLSNAQELSAGTGGRFA